MGKNEMLKDDLENALLQSLSEQDVDKLRNQLIRIQKTSAEGLTSYMMEI